MIDDGLHDDETASSRGIEEGSENDKSDRGENLPDVDVTW